MLIHRREKERERDMRYERDIDTDKRGYVESRKLSYIIKIYCQILGLLYGVATTTAPVSDTISSFLHVFLDCPAFAQSSK